jgi:hypothetical protein
MDKLSERWMFYCGLLAGMGVGVDDLKHIQDLIDAEEQGLLLRLPCKVGDTLYAFYYSGDYIMVVAEEVIEITVPKEGILIETYGGYYRFDDFGKTVFTTKEEAEKKLESMKGE